jgi:hypothetical protein
MNQQALPLSPHTMEMNHTTNESSRQTSTSMIQRASIFILIY